MPGDSLDEDFGDFEMADFGVVEEGHPDEVALPGSHGNSSNETPQILSSGNSSDPSKTSANSVPPKPMQPPARPMVRTGSNGPPPRPPHTPNQPPQRPGVPFQGRPNPPATSNQAATKPQPQPPNQLAQPVGAGSGAGTPPPNRGPSEPAAFFSARSLKDIPESAAPGPVNVPLKGAQAFNPRADSPSIRKTPGIDHQSSRPVAKNGQHVAPTKRELDQPRAQSPRPGNNGFNNGPNLGAGRPGMGNPVGNPMLNHARQIGAPGGGGSPLGNRGAYKPPTTVKRPAPGVVENGNRTPLTEVSNNNAANAVGGGGTDAKRQKVT